MTIGFACSATNYKLIFAHDEQIAYTLAEIPVATMTVDPPKGMAFTGMMFGLYAFGELEPCLSHADFEFVKWTKT